MATESFPAGTNTIFYQSTAPVGWTTSTSYNDNTLRIVSGSTGGTLYNTAGTAFSTFFSPTRTLNSVTGYNNTITSPLATADTPAHTHTTTGYNAPGTSSTRRSPTSGNSFIGVASSYASSPSPTAFGTGSHSHPYSFGCTFSVPTANMNFGINYMTFIVATKN